MGRYRGSCRPWIGPTWDIRSLPWRASARPALLRRASLYQVWSPRTSCEDVSSRPIRYVCNSSFSYSTVHVGRGVSVVMGTKVVSWGVREARVDDRVGFTTHCVREGLRRRRYEGLHMPVSCLVLPNTERWMEYARSLPRAHQIPSPTLSWSSSPFLGASLS